jgi:hypothetical protein
LRDPEVEGDRGHYLCLGGDYSEAIEPLTFAIENWGNRDSLYMHYWDRGIAYECLEQYDAAIRDLTNAIALEPSAFIYHSRGLAYLNKGDFHAALLDFTSGLELLPIEYKCMQRAAWLLACSPIDEDRDDIQAKKLATQLCEECEYSEPEYLDILACAHAECGDFDSAIDLEHIALKMIQEYSGEEEFETDPLFIAICHRQRLFESRQPYRIEPAG